MGYTSNKLRVLIASGKDFQITPREMASIADQLDEKDVELTALRERLRWVPVGERLPELWTHVEIECRPPLARFWIGCLRDDFIWAGMGGANLGDSVVAWRYIDAEPLPAAPEVPQ